MQALEHGMDPSAEASSEPVRIWIETEDGSIARGVVEFLTEDGALLALADIAALDGGADVQVRLSFHPTSPTLGLPARLLWVRAKDEASACELEWLPGPGREQLAALLNATDAA